VAHVMAENKYGSAVVVDRAKIVGMFTTVDALSALAQWLADKPQALTGS
jgi:CBS domain-containing protein